MVIVPSWRKVKLEKLFVIIASCQKVKSVIGDHGKKREHTLMVIVACWRMAKENQISLDHWKWKWKWKVSVVITASWRKVKSVIIARKVKVNNIICESEKCQWWSLQVVGKSGGRFHWSSSPTLRTTTCWIIIGDLVKIRFQWKPAPQSGQNWYDSESASSQGCQCRT